MVDRSNDSGIAKMFPIFIRTFDINYGHTMMKLFNISILEGHTTSSVEHMFISIDVKLVKNDIPW